MKNIVRKPTQCKSIEEFNDILKRLKDIVSQIYYEKYTNDFRICYEAYFWETPKYYYIAFNDSKHRIYYVDKNGEYKKEPEVSNIMSQLSKVYKPQEVKEFMPEYEYNEKIGIDGKPIGYRECIGSASPIRDSNPKYRNKVIYAYEYDLVSAYGQFLKEPLPDLSTVQYNTTVKNGQIGFYICGCTMMGYNQLRMTTNPGVHCDWVFDLMESPYKQWCDKTFKELNKETDKDKREQLKDRFRISVGQLQHHNPFWRATIVEKCNHLISSLRSDDTIYWSTDSLVTKNMLNLLDTGYLWKVKHSGEFKLKGRLNHQWGNEMPVISGIESLYVKWYNKTHNKPFDLLKDKMPQFNGSAYVFDKNQFKLIKNKEITQYE